MSAGNEFEWQMLALINAERAAIGANPLKLELTLNTAAEDHSQWMLTEDEFSHTGVNASDPGDRMDAAGFEFSGGYGWAENLAGRTINGVEGYSDEVVALHQQLMNSDGHRANLLNPAYEYIGIGFEVGEFEGRTWAVVTQKFAYTQGSVDLDTTNLEAYELQFASDFNSDGVIGYTMQDIDTAGIGLQNHALTGYLITEGAASHMVTYAGAAVGANSFAGWQAVAAGSDGADGYSLLWLHSSGTYGVWNLDSEGAHYAFPDTSNIVDFEDRFALDLNGDNSIGHTVQDIDTSGVGLELTTQKGYVIVDGASTPTVTYNGGAVDADSFDGWQAIAAGSDAAGGYSLLWVHTSGDYGIWNLDSEGAQYAFPDTSNLVDYEDRFDFDLNGDGTVGHKVDVLDNTGIGLNVSTEHGYVVVDGDDMHVVTYGGVATGPDSFEGWQALAAGIDDAGGYSILWLHSSGAYGVWNLDTSGAHKDFPDTSDIRDYEYRFAMDLNNDLLIG